MIDENKLLSELEKWMNDTAYLKEKYSGSVQFKDGAGDNIIYAHAEIAYDVISTVIDKINEQKKDWKYVPENKMQKDLKKQIIRCICGDCDYCQYYDKTVNACNHEALARKVDNAYVSEWTPCSEQLPKEIEKEGINGIRKLYFVTFDDGTNGIGSYMHNEKGWLTRKFYREKEFSTDDTVVAWMKLPAPYKNDNDD